MIPYGQGSRYRRLIIPFFSGSLLLFFFLKCSLIDKLPDNKSSGLKDLPIKAVIDAKDSISMCLSHIMNNIFEQCKNTTEMESSYRGNVGCIAHLVHDTNTTTLQIDTY